MDMKAAGWTCLIGDGAKRQPRSLIRVNHALSLAALATRNNDLGAGVRAGVPESLRSPLHLLHRIFEPRIGAAADLGERTLCVARTGQNHAHEPVRVSAAIIAHPTVIRG
jgi:hypothetical protein